MLNRLLGDNASVFKWHGLFRAISWALLTLVFLTVTPLQTMAQTGQYEGFEWQGYASTIMIWGYTGLGGAVIIPTTINNLPVTSIQEGAFAGCSRLTDVTIHGRIRSIAKDAFNGCSGLTNVTIGNCVTSIEGFAFSGCSRLNNVTIPSSVTGIGGYAFRYTSSLTSIYFQGNAPHGGSDSTVFYGNTNVIVHYLAGTTGWGPMFGGRPTALWTPTPTLTAQYAAPNVLLTWSSGVLIESTNLSSGVWTTNAAAQSPYTVAPGGTQKFYRVKIN